MSQNRRLSVRKLMVWVAILAGVLALARIPILFVMERSAYSAKNREGDALVWSYRAHQPAGLSPGAWEQAVTAVQIAWGNVVSSPEHCSISSAENLLTEMRRVAATVTSATAEGDLYFVLDLLAHETNVSNMYYLSGQYQSVRSSLGAPRSGLVSYALDLSKAGPPEKPLPILSQLLQDKAWHTRVAACRAIGELAAAGSDVGALDVLIAALKNEEPLVRAIAIQCLSDLGPQADPAIPALIRTLEDDPHAGVRHHAAWALPSVGRPGEATISALTRAIRSTDRRMRWMAIVSLSQRDLVTAQAAPNLISILNDPAEDYSMISAAAGALEKLQGPVPKELVPAMIAAIKKRQASGSSQDTDSTHYIADAIGGFGPEAREAVPFLVNILTHTDMAMRYSAARSLGRIQAEPATVIPALTRVLNDNEPVVRAYSAEALGAFGSRAASALKELKPLLQDRDPRVRESAAQAIQQIGPG